MGTYTAANGTTFTDDDIERWAADDESDAGYTGPHFGPPTPGRPLTIGEHAAKSRSFRLGAERLAWLDARARAEHSDASKVLRDLIDANR